MAPANVKPLVPTTIRTEFGEVLESEAFRSQSGADGDFTYVPGYSDLRRARDQAQKEVIDGKRNAKDIPNLPVRLQWVRSVRVNNTPDNRKPVEFGNQSYRNVTQDDIGQPWFTGMPDGAVVEAGGEIRQGDCTLMVVDAPKAAKNAAAGAQARAPRRRSRWPRPAPLEATLRSTLDCARSQAAGDRQAPTATPLRAFPHARFRKPSQAPHCPRRGERAAAGSRAPHRAAGPGAARCGRRSAGGAGRDSGGAAGRLAHRQLHGVTAVAIRSFRVVSSVAATAGPLRRCRGKAPRG